jgi:tRNA/rRNA methyltransferase
MKPPVFILVEPQLGENIGMAARSIRNFGFKELRIVNPRDGWPNPRATAAAADAFDSMDVSVSTSIHDAVADLHSLFATTARTREHQNLSPTSALQHVYSNQKNGILFGAEKNGLSNAHIALCQYAISLPVDASFPSLNLAQAVAVIAYSLQNLNPSLDQNPSPLASQDDIHALFSSLSQKLKQAQYFSPQNLASRTLRIQRLLSNASLSPADVRLLHGIFRALSGKNQPSHNPNT